ncbi:MAG TPA: hypothetical protein VK579_14945 [Terriglobales bacterium]|nr:hypothetical protein [Terriglobales bacterium]
MRRTSYQKGSLRLADRKKGKVWEFLWREVQLDGGIRRKHIVGYSKIYAEPFNSFWCCSGTGVEEFAKLPDSIYFHDQTSIFVNLYIASDVNWTEKAYASHSRPLSPKSKGRLSRSRRQNLLMLI